MAVTWINVLIEGQSFPLKLWPASQKEEMKTTDMAWPRQFELCCQISAKRLGGGSAKLLM